MVRRAAVRVIVLDGLGRLLLLNTRDPARPWFEWWELPGGGIKPQEMPHAAALRELHEETGIVAQRVGQSVGIVEAEFSFGGRDYRQTEEVFVLHVEERPVSPAGLDGDLERQAHLRHRWWLPADAFVADINLYPPQLPDLYRKVAAMSKSAGISRDSPAILPRSKGKG